MKRFIFILLVLCGYFSSQSTYAQAFTYFPANSIFSVSTNPTKKVWVDFRFQMNSYFSSLSSEISPMVNVKKIGLADFFVGGGVQYNFLKFIDTPNAKPLDGYFLNFGVRTTPFEKAKKVQLIFELSPYAEKKFDSGVFRAKLGIGYVFSKK